MATTQGQDTVEYGLLIAVLAVLVLLGAGTFGAAMAAWFERLISAVTVLP